MRFESTPHVREVASRWKQEAERLGDTFIGLKHVLLAMLTVEDATAPTLLRALGCDLQDLRATLEALPDEGPQGADPERVPLTREVERALSQARREAARLGSPRVGTEHLLLGMLAGRFYGLGRASAVAEMLARKYEVTYRDVRRLLRERAMADA